MNTPDILAKRSRAGLVASFTLIAAIVFFLAARFVQLDADFPGGFNTSRDVMTDEGWYASAAVRQMVAGDWYQAGDLNTAVNLPIGAILHYGVMSIFGRGLASARLTIVIASVLTVVLAWALVRLSWGHRAGLLAALLLATQQVGFAYSRFAIMEPLMMLFVAASLLVAAAPGRRGPIPRLIAAGILMAAAMLTKTSAAYALPALAYLGWRCGRSRRDGLMLAALTTGVCLAMTAGYGAIARQLYPEDFEYFFRISVAAKSDFDVELLSARISGAFEQLGHLGAGFLGATSALAVAGCAVSRRFRSDPVAHALAGWIAVLLAGMFAVEYQPLRYFVPLLTPAACLGAMGGAAVVERLGSARGHMARLATWAPSALVLAVALFGAVAIVRDLRTPRYSFVEMAREIGQIIDRTGTPRSQAMLFGNAADTVALEIGARGVSRQHGTKDARGRLATYRPRFALFDQEGRELKYIPTESRGRTLGSWDVYAAYADGPWTFRLIELDWNQGALDENGQTNDD